MAEFILSKEFKRKAASLMEEIAQYFYSNGYCGKTTAKNFHNEMMKSIEKISNAPLALSSDWGHPQRRSFFECRGQYTLILIVSPPNASKNKGVSKVLFTNIYSSSSKEGNSQRPKEKRFDASELLED